MEGGVLVRGDTQGGEDALSLTAASPHETEQHDGNLRSLACAGYASIRGFTLKKKKNTGERETEIAHPMESFV